MPNEPKANSLWHLIDEHHLQWLTGEDEISKGRALYENGSVKLVIAGSTDIEAIVSDNSAEYKAELAVRYDGDLLYKCQCPEGKEELFCQHLAATALLWLDGNYDQQYAPAGKNANLHDSQSEDHCYEQQACLLSDFRSKLELLDKATLIDLLLDCATRDTDLPKKLDSGEFQVSIIDESFDDSYVRHEIDMVFGDLFYISEHPDYSSIDPKT